MKYVVIEVKDHARLGSNADIVREVPIIFPDFLVHADVEQAIHRVLRRERPDGRMRELTTVSAGFCSSLNLKANCHGESESIGVESRPAEDTRLIQGMDYHHGIQP